MRLCGNSIALQINMPVDLLEGLKGVSHNILKVIRTSSAPFFRSDNVTLLPPPPCSLPLPSAVRAILDWDRPDILRELLEDADFEQDAPMEDLMVECLMEQKVEFVEALVSYGFAMKKLVRVEVLRELYRRVVRKRKDC